MQDDAQGYRREPAPQPGDDVDGNILLLTGISVAVSAFFASFYPGRWFCRCCPPCCC